MKDLADEVLLGFQYALKEKKQSCVIECPEQVPCVSADKAKIEQVLVNLIDNAIKYTPEEGMITLALEEAGADVMMRITDTGIGIAREECARIFERFYCVDKARSRQYGGTGLGLSIVKHIVLLHHGSVSVDSVVGRGTTICVQLPQ